MRARGPLGRGRRVPQTVSHIDVAPTVLEVLGLPPADMEGRSLLPLLEGESGDRPAFAQSYHGTGSVALTRGRLKYVFTPARAPTAPVPAPEDEPILPAEPQHQLYDLREDPGEAHDLSTVRAALTRQLQAEVRAWLEEQHRRGEAVAKRAGPAGGAPRGPDPIVEGQLRALGYVN
jgi:arylsulfatase A-like enzyme